MKKILITSLVASSFVFGATDEQISAFYTQMLPQGLSASVKERTKVDKYPDIESVVVHITDGKISESDVVFTKGDLIFPDVLDLKNNKSLKAEFNDKMLIQKLSSVYKAEDKSNIITLGNDSKKATEVIFSDPECPYCRAELKNIEKTLKEKNVKIIMTPVHDVSSLEKTHMIYKEIAKAKSDSDKVKILRKYFDEKATVPAGTVSEADINKLNDLRQKYFKAGVRSVPYIVEEASLLK